VGIDVDTVVRASVEIADAEGLEALTMRRVASALAVTPMAIYHHVPGKEALLDLIADESMKALPVPRLDGDWEEELIGFFVAFHRLYLEHPALAQVMAQRPLEGPTAIARGELLLAMLVEAGVPDDRAVATLVTLVGYTIGMSLYRLSRSEPGRFGGLSAESAPTAHRLRQRIAESAEHEDLFVDGVRRLIESYCR